MPATAHDRIIHPVLASLRNCLAAQLAQVERPVCYLPIVFGDSHPPADSCTCECADNGQGQGWVRFVSATSAALATSGTRSRKLASAGCVDGLGFMDVTLDLGVYRCALVLDQDGTPPTDEEYIAHSRGMHEDLLALRRAVACCAVFDRHELQHSMENLVATGPAGGCVGAVLTMKVRLADCGCPE